MHRRSAIILTTLSLLLAAFVAAMPLGWMVWRSFRLADHGGGAFTLEHYARALLQLPAARWMVNSLFLASMQTLIACAAATLAGHVLAHHRFRLRVPLLVILFATLLLPAQVTLPAAWELLRELRLLNSYMAFLLPSAANVLGALLFYQACRQMPDELLDAARIDGCSEFRIWWSVTLPVVQPTLVTFAVLSFTANWNAYLWPQIVLQDSAKYTLAMGLANLSSLPGPRDIAVLQAATSISLLPAFALFLAARASLEESLLEGTQR